MPTDKTETFADLIGGAQQAPPDPGGGANVDLPRLFDLPTPPSDIIEDNVAPPNAAKIGGVPKYKMQAHFRRFIIGPVTTGFGPQSDTTDHDDTVDYELVQNKCLSGEAILRWEKVNFLKEGTVVIAMSWLTKTNV